MAEPAFFVNINMHSHPWWKALAAVSLGRMARQASPALTSRISTRIKELRASRGWSQERVAELARVPVETLSRCENGHLTPTLPTLEALAGAFEVSLASLLDDGRAPERLSPQEAELVEIWRRIDTSARGSLLDVLRRVR